ncbi:MAG: SbcC/MukB-like Walker B domain-containing protein, partial [Bradymonadaceae bacterium]
MSELSVEDREVVAEAVIEPATRRELEQQIDQLERDLDDAEGDLEEARRALRARWEQRPEGIVPGRTEVRELEASVERLEEQRDGLQTQIGKCRQKLEDVREELEAKAELEAQLEEREAEVALWEEMAELIGTGKGEEFKRFAKALNLREIVGRANEKLDDLRERYRLAVAQDEDDYPELEFVVVDREHEHTRRPLETLSGGETFLVSLALALALADYRQVEMPVETLFLDEGFGTLDRDALDDAISTLGALHAETDRTVGTIRHVEALKERIDHRIVEGGGVLARLVPQDVVWCLTEPGFREVVLEVVLGIEVV